MRELSVKFSLALLFVAIAVALIGLPVYLGNKTDACMVIFKGEARAIQNEMNTVRIEMDDLKNEVKEIHDRVLAIQGKMLENKPRDRK